MGVWKAKLRERERETEKDVGVVVPP